METLQPPVYLVLFDCDGVLVNSEEIIFDTEMGMLADIGLIYTDTEHQELFSGLTREATKALIQREYVEKMGIELPEGFYEQMYDAYRAAEKSSLRAVTGIKALLETLKARGIPYGVASNAPLSGITRKLDMTGLAPKFEKKNLFSKDMVPHPKPAPDLYLHAMRQMGFDDPARTLVIEDSVIGVTAGVAAGMQVIGYAGGSHRPAHHVDNLIEAGAFRAVGSLLEITQELDNSAG